MILDDLLTAVKLFLLSTRNHFERFRKLYRDGVVIVSTIIVTFSALVALGDWRKDVLNPLRTEVIKQQLTALTDCLRVLELGQNNNVIYDTAELNLKIEIDGRGRVYNTKNLVANEYGSTISPNGKERSVVTMYQMANDIFAPFSMYSDYQELITNFEDFSNRLILSSDLRSEFKSLNQEATHLVAVEIPEAISDARSKNIMKKDDFYEINKVLYDKIGPSVNKMKAHMRSVYSEIAGILRFDEIYKVSKEVAR